MWRLDWKTLHYIISLWSLLPQNTTKDKHSAGFKHGKYDLSSQTSLSPMVHSREFFHGGTHFVSFKIWSRGSFSETSSAKWVCYIAWKKGRGIAFHQKKMKCWQISEFWHCLWDSGEIFREFCSFLGILRKMVKRKEPAVKDKGKRKKKNSEGNSCGGGLVAKQGVSLWRLSVLFYTCESWRNKPQS